MENSRGNYKPLEAMRRMTWKEWVSSVIVVLIPLAGGLLAAKMLNAGAYKSGVMSKPDWAPPSWLFGPVWSVLYLMMGFASLLVYRCGGGLNQLTTPPLILYVLQLAINWSWTPTFFGHGYFAVALSELWASWGLIVSCIVTFTPVSKVAALLLLPYLAWVSFAGALNLSILCLNDCVTDLNPNNNTLI